MREKRAYLGGDSGEPRLRPRMPTVQDVRGRGPARHVTYRHERAGGRDRGG